jgi:rhamnosyl/mannosyltransferase
MSGIRAQLIITYHSDVIRQRIQARLFAPFLESALRRSSAIIVSSPNYLDSSAILRRHRAKCSIVPFGIPDIAADIRRKQMLPTKPSRAQPVVLAVGRLVYYKGFDVLIRAMASLDAKLIIVGEGPLRSELEGLIITQGMRNRASIVTGVDDTSFYYDMADIFVLPSVARSEAFGIVQLEAMAFGKPVINTELDTGVPYVSIDRASGLTVPPGDVDALKRALHLLLHDESLRSKLGGMARKRYQEMFTATMMAQLTFDIYNRVMGCQTTAQLTSAMALERVEPLSEAISPLVFKNSKA